MEMPKVHPECLALAMLRRLRGVANDEVSDPLGISHKALLKHESSTPPPADRLEAILEILGFDLESYLEIAAAVDRAWNRRLPADPPPATPVDPTPEERREMQVLAAQAARASEQLALDLLDGTARERKTAIARSEARALCDRLEKGPKPGLIVEKAREVQTWAVAEELAHRSAAAATERPGRALELAELACRVAELAPCSDTFRHRLLGYTLTFRENALRAAHRLSEAEALSVLADTHWRAGAAAPGPLAEWRRLSLEGSLLRDLRRFPDAIAHLDASLALAPDSARGSLLVSKALTLELMGDAEQALALLTEAQEAVGPDPRRAFIVRFNLAAFLCRLGRFAAAELALREIEAAPGALLPLDKVGADFTRPWLSWLRGSIAGGFGHWDGADKAYRAALRAFARRGAARECALISLELAVLLSRQRRARDLRELARGLEWVLAEKKLSREGHAAVRLFCDAAEDGEVTPELAERAFQTLLRAPNADAPGRFEGTTTDDIASFTLAGAAGGDASFLCTDGGSDGPAASTAGIEAAAAVQSLGSRGWRGQEIADCVPEPGRPGGEMIDQAGGLHGSGRAPREDR